MPSNHVLALCAAAAVATGVAPASADEWQPDRLPFPPHVRNGFSAKVLVGPSYRSLHGHHVGGIRNGIGVGAQFKDIGALHGTMLLLIGRTDAGLRFSSYGGSVTWEHMFDRLRIGGGPAIDYLVLERATHEHSELVHFGVGGTLFLSYDLVQSAHANVLLGLHGELVHLPSDDVLPGLWLNVGGRFKAP